MAHQTKLNNANPSSIQHQKEANKMFHDFLGMKAQSADSPVVLGTKNADASPSASISTGAASSGGGVRGPLSTTSDIASERQSGNHLEGIPYYGPRSDIAGTKRSNSDSAFTGSTRDGIPHIGHDSLESLHLMKMFKSREGAERPRRSNDDEALYGMQSIRPIGGRFDGSVPNSAAKWDRSIPMGSVAQYPPRAGQFVPFSPMSKLSSGPSLISQSAADEGSRTGIKGPGILSSINAASEKNALGATPSGSKPRPGIHALEPESSTPSNRQSLMSGSRQMTIFYGGQAHVFDDVHPNKADVIMALAGSNGGSWSTTYSSKPTRPPMGENYVTSGENEANASAFQREIRGKLLASTSNPNQGLGSGVHHGSIEEKRRQIQAGETSGEEKREVVLK